VEIELVPDPGPDDPAAEAAVAALVGEGLTADPLPAGVSSAWRRAGVAEATSRDTAPVHDRPRHGGAAHVPRPPR
jgi:hypothetical protein